MKMMLPRRKFIGLAMGGFCLGRKLVGAAGAPTAPAEWPPLAWKRAQPSPFARVEAPAVVVGDKFYVFGGSTDTLDSSNQLDVYDPAKDSWTRKKEMPARLTHLNAALDGGTIWFAGGFRGKHPGPVTNEVWKYDIATDSWLAGSPLPEPRGGGGLALLDRRLHYFGGFKADRDTNSGDHWSLALDGGTSWGREPDLPEPRGHVTAATLDGRIYALGGTHGHDKTQIDLDACHRFDPAEKKWTQIASLPDGRSHFESSTMINRGRILIIGGRCNSSHPSRNVVDDMLEYDPRTNSWRVVGRMPQHVMAPSAGIVERQLVVVAGGLNNPRPLTTETWTAELPDGE